MSLPVIHTFDSRQPAIVRPGEIQAGDYMRDVGRLRPVERAQTADGITSVRLEDDPDGRHDSLTVNETVTVIVWRHAHA